MPLFLSSAIAAWSIASEVMFLMQDVYFDAENSDKKELSNNNVDTLSNTRGPVNEPGSAVRCNEVEFAGQCATRDDAMQPILMAAEESGSSLIEDEMLDIVGVGAAQMPAQSMPNLTAAADANAGMRTSEAQMSSRKWKGTSEQVLRQEVTLLQQELSKCRETITKLYEREKKLKERISEQAQRQLQKSNKFEDLSLGDNRPTQLVRRYDNLYSQTRVDALDALDELPEMSEFEDLKGKLLFSVVVLAFRSTQQTVRNMYTRLRKMLHLKSTDPLANEVEDTVEMYLRKSIDKYELTSNVHEVCEQLWKTLYEYPNLQACDGLLTYIHECVKVAWALAVQNPPLVIDYESRLFKEDMHSRFHTSNPEENRIRSIIWPALLEGDNGPCLSKGIVIT